MQLEVGGVHYGGFQSASLTLRLDQLSKTFAFEATSANGGALPFVAGESCRVYVDGDQQFSGWIEAIDVSGSSTDHRISVSGRDRPADIADSSFGAMNDIQPPVSLARVCQLVIEHIGATIAVRDIAKPAQFESAEDLIAPEPGGSCIELLEALARKRHVLLSSDGAGRLVIINGKGTRIAAFLRHHVTDVENNVLRYAVKYDHSGRFNTYRVASQLSPAAGLGLVDTDSGATDEQVASTSAEEVDAGIRKGRLMTIAGESASSDGQNKERATWEASVRRARSRVYSCTVHGFRNQTGALWAVNTVPQVHEEYAGIEGRMLINSVNFTFDSTQGRNTNLTLIEEDAYVLSLEQPKKPVQGKGLTWDGLEDEKKRFKAQQEAVEKARAGEQIVDPPPEEE